MLQRWRESNPYFFNMAEILTQADMERIARESVLDMVNVLKLHNKGGLMHSDEFRSLFSDIYQAGMIKTLNVLKEKR